MSIESNDKPGLYLAVDLASGSIPLVLSRMRGSQDEAERMTFKTLDGFAGSGVTFESVKYPPYLVSKWKNCRWQNPEDKEANLCINGCSSQVWKCVKDKAPLYGREKLDTDDIRIQLYSKTGAGEDRRIYDECEDRYGYKAGEKTLKVTYKYQGKEYEDSIKIVVEIRLSRKIGICQRKENRKYEKK